MTTYAITLLRILPFDRVDFVRTIIYMTIIFPPVLSVVGQVVLMQGMTVTLAFDTSRQQNEHPIPIDIWSLISPPKEGHP